MNIKGFSQKEQEALLDLLILGMYSDGHLASAEDARIQKLTESLDLPGEYGRQQFLDAAFNRARQRPGGIAAREGIAAMGAAFSSPAHRQQACAALAELLGSDQEITESEREFLHSVRTVFDAE